MSSKPSAAGAAIVGGAVPPVDLHRAFEQELHVVAGAPSARRSRPRSSADLPRRAGDAEQLVDRHELEQRDRAQRGRRARRPAAGSCGVAAAGRARRARARAPSPRRRATSGSAVRARRAMYSRSSASAHDPPLARRNGSPTRPAPDRRRARAAPACRRDRAARLFSTLFACRTFSASGMSSRIGITRLRTVPASSVVEVLDGARARVRASPCSIVVRAAATSFHGYSRPSRR